MSALSAGLLGAIVTGLVLGYFLHRMTCQRDVARAVVRRQDAAMRIDARRIRVLKDDRDLFVRRHLSAADQVTLLTAELARRTIERDHARTTLEIQIADPRVALLLPSNVVALRKAGRR